MNHPSRSFTVKDFSDLNYEFGNELNLFVFYAFLYCANLSSAKHM